LGVAVANAAPILKEAADVVAAADNDGHAVAEALRAFVLNK
jgi:hydroxymethylpyrimidine pyrophosphatase-like HAD family hydrolase